MPIDISAKLSQDHHNMNYREFSELLESSARVVGDGLVDWDDGAEEWGRVFLGKELVALIWKQAGFAFVDARYRHALETFLHDRSIQTEFAKDLEGDRYQVDLEVVSRVSGLNEFWREFDPNDFTAGDLWFATV